MNMKADSRHKRDGELLLDSVSVDRNDKRREER